MPDSEVLARIRAICSQFPDAQEGLLQERPVFHVRRRRFVIFNGSVGLHSDARFRASPHHGFRGWMALDLQPGAIDWREIMRLIEAAYRHVAGRALVAELDARQR